LNQLVGTMGLFAASQALFMGAMLCTSRRNIRYTNQVLACLSLVLMSTSPANRLRQLPRQLPL